MASPVYRPSASRAASLSGEDSAFQPVEKRGRPVQAALPHRPSHHRFTVQTTAGLVGKYQSINERFSTLARYSPQERREIMESRAEAESRNRSLFTYKGKLGEGTYSIVYRVQRGAIEAAAKLSTPAAFAHNQREAAILQKLQGSHFVPRLLHQGFESAPREFAFVMELIPENFWSMFLSKRRTLNLAQVRILALRMMEAVSDFRRRRIGHADLKPENFSFDGNELKIFDFGIAFEPGGKQNRTVQSAFYRAPEAWADQAPFTPEIDLWSVACILFEAYLGVPLFPFRDDPNGEASFFYLVSRHIGPPPLSFLRDRRTPERIRKLFSYLPQTGKIQYAGPVPEGIDGRGIGERILEKAAAKGDSRDDAILFFDFLRDLLRYEGRVPPERALRHRLLQSLS